MTIASTQSNICINYFVAYADIYDDWSPSIQSVPVTSLTQDEVDPENWTG